MSITDRYDQRMIGADGRGRPRADVQRRTRVKLVAFAILTVLATVAGLPVWSVVALLATTAAIPVAAELHGLRPLLGVRLLGGRRTPDASYPMVGNLVDSALLHHEAGGLTTVPEGRGSTRRWAP